jgi:hypothetical protein
MPSAAAVSNERAAFLAAHTLTQQSLVVRLGADLVFPRAALQNAWTERTASLESRLSEVKITSAIEVPAITATH